MSGKLQAEARTPPRGPQLGTAGLRLSCTVTSGPCIPNREPPRSPPGGRDSPCRLVFLRTCRRARARPPLPSRVFFDADTPKLGQTVLEVWKRHTRPLSVTQTPTSPPEQLSWGVGRPVYRLHQRVHPAVYPGPLRKNSRHHLGPHGKHTGTTADELPNKCPPNPVKFLRTFTGCCWAVLDVGHP